MVVFHIEHPTAIYNPNVYNCTNLELNHMPNLSDHPEIQTCYYNMNDICSIRFDLFPPNVKEVSFYNNCIGEDGLPVRWPNTLKIILLDRNQIKTTNTVAEWPPTLETLSLDDNPLMEVPQRLPSDLILLSVSYCKLATLRNLPVNLKRVRAYYNKLHSIESLPSALEYLHLGNNYLRSASFSRCILPSTLRFLNLDYNRLTNLPNVLPDTLETLSIVGNELTNLPTQLPASLKLLIVNANRIRSFKPTWKPGQRLFQLHIRDNCLTENLLALKEEGIIDDIFQGNNWNQGIHHIHARKIQRMIKRHIFQKAFRVWAAHSRIRDELITVSYSPELVMKYHDIETIRTILWDKP